MVDVIRAEQLGREIADALLAHAFDVDDAPTMWQRMTLVLDALRVAGRIVSQRRAQMVRAVEQKTSPKEAARLFGLTEGTLNLLFRRRKRGASDRAELG